uniref:Intraflagellar transport protein 46 homolog n=1 Tax=Hucho hucho TaxID=62062 RepID=A0A4W5RT34_9TELE
METIYLIPFHSYCSSHSVVRLRFVYNLWYHFPFLTPLQKSQHSVASRDLVSLGDGTLAFMARAEKQKTKLITNQPYDESLEVNDYEEIASVYTPTPRRPGTKSHLPKKKEQRNSQPGLSENEEEEEEEDDDDDSDETESDEEEGEPGSAPEGAYDPADYDHLPVTAEIKELFQYITRYTPQTIELDHKLKPFIPDFIPAVGDIDAFLKVPRPDGKADNLGLLVLDEPCTKQSDPTVLSLWLSENSKQHNIAEVKVKSVENPEKNPKAIENWIESISELHRSKPPATVHYTRSMPDIDTLMQEWPPEFEELLGKVSLPTADINCDLTEYIEVICGILDIPIYKSRIHSLHVLFTLYSEFKNSQHFKALAEGQKSDTLSAPRSTTGETETLAFD